MSAGTGNAAAPSQGTGADFGVVLNDEPGLQQAGIRSEQRLAEAAAYFTDYLQRAKSEQGDGYAQWLQDLHAKLTYQLKFTMYRVTDADAGSIFEVMNARGKPLTDLELVKNYLLFAASKLEVLDHKLREEVNDAWGEMFEKLMRAHLLANEDENQLLRTHWLMAYDPQSPRWKGSKAVRATFSMKAYEGAHEDLLEELLGYVRSLRASCEAFCEIGNPRDARVKDAFSRITQPVHIRGATHRAGLVS